MQDTTETSNDGTEMDIPSTDLDAIRSIVEIDSHLTNAEKVDMINDYILTRDEDHSVQESLICALLNQMERWPMNPFSMGNYEP